jgi:hypothetical protein
MSNFNPGGVLDRAWTGFVDFYREFTAGPNYVKVRKKQPLLKKKTKKRTKSVIIKPEPKELKQEQAVLKQKRPVEQFEKEPNWNSVLKEEEADYDSDEKRAEVRVEQITKAEVHKKKSRRHPLEPEAVSRKRKHLLFMNPGTQKILECVRAVNANESLPLWAQPFRTHLSVEGNTLYFDNLPMATQEQKREVVKNSYFDPKEASTILPITEKLRLEFANVTKKDVTRILRSLETYQRNFRRRLPAKVLGRMVLNKPGVIMMDTFYPSRKVDGWFGNYSCLCCMDAWSRYSRVYVNEKKDKLTISKGMERFLAEFASKGHLPRMILMDKGSELKAAGKAIEKYRQKPGDMVHNSVTGQPVLMVENMQSQYQRRMAVFRTASLTDDPSVIMDDISEHLNNQRRPDRGNLTPVQLLTLSGAERKVINEKYRDRTVIPEVAGLRKLEVGHSVRVLLMTRKEQVDTSKKGFRPKWSRQVYTVLKKRALQLNPNNFRYFVGSNQSYYRHELLWVPKETDTEVVQGLVGNQSSLIEEAGTEWSDEEYNPESD